MRGNVWEEAQEYKRMVSKFTKKQNIGGVLTKGTMHTNPSNNNSNNMELIDSVGISRWREHIQ